MDKKAAAVGTLATSLGSATQEWSTNDGFCAGSSHSKRAATGATTREARRGTSQRAAPGDEVTRADAPHRSVAKAVRPRWPCIVLVVEGLRTREQKPGQVRPCVGVLQPNYPQVFIRGRATDTWRGACGE